jgi:transcriptional regulator with XRE-family HTH domain
MERMADRIKRLRLENKMTQEELGNVIGVQKSAIRKYESGAVQNIKRTSIKKMADCFGVSPSYLLGYEDSEDVAEEQEETPEEKRMNELFKSVPKENQKELLDLIETALKMSGLKKKEK